MPCIREHAAFVIWERVVAVLVLLLLLFRALHRSVEATAQRSMATRTRSKRKQATRTFPPKVRRTVVGTPNDTVSFQCHSVDNWNSKLWAIYSELGAPPEPPVHPTRRWKKKALKTDAPDIKVTRGFNVILLVGSYRIPMHVFGDTTARQIVNYVAAKDTKGEFMAGSFLWHSNGIPPRCPINEWVPEVVPDNGIQVLVQSVCKRIRCDVDLAISLPL